ncbi:hypothetical protein ACIHDR_40870 [Nocardia sp. NPDC052278]|uniref:hypothetical protein n=1 Tax=unclassified Nocardia TaxID=2637762 RepID=UPI0036C9850A
MEPPQPRNQTPVLRTHGVITQFTTAATTWRRGAEAVLTGGDTLIAGSPMAYYGPTPVHANKE